jgi:hypothetical protein
LPRKKLKFIKKGEKQGDVFVKGNRGICYEPESGSEFEPEGASSSEDMCAECEEPYAATEQNGDCITRVDCSKWLHELCTVYGDRCNSCGKQFTRKKKGK